MKFDEKGDGLPGTCKLEPELENSFYIKLLEVRMDSNEKNLNCLMSTGFLSLENERIPMKGETKHLQHTVNLRLEVDLILF